MTDRSKKTSLPSASRANILGVLISPINMQQALQTIDAWIANREPHYVTVTPAHAVMDAYQDPELRPIFNHSGLTTPDGMAIVWLLKLRGYRDVSRVYGPDLMLETCRAGLEFGYRHFLYGGAEGVATALADKLRARFPGLQVVGTHTPPFRELTEEEDQAVVDKINAARPDIVWVGLSTPKQERWMAAHLGRIETPVMIGVGAAFDFLSGKKPQAPRWAQRSGLEWLFRLASEPRRLWPRYRQYPKFVLLALGQWLGLRDYSLD
jgi:N-acetylglucosaminyldiphosphoundecaprenol N-acetyl-beta-D-mannosaminyltransferase